MQLELEDIADVMAGLVRDATAPLIAANEALAAENKVFAERLAAVEARELPEAVKGDPGDPGRAGADCDMEAVERMIAERIAALPTPEPGAPGEPGRDGRDVDMDTIREMIGDAVAALPPPDKGDPGEPGKDGASVDMAEVKRAIAEEVVTAVSTLTPAQKGEDGKDGLGLANALIDRDGCLVLTMTDGTQKNLGAIVGKDGDPGKDGLDGHTFTLDDFDIVPLDDDRSFKFCFTNGEVMHSFEFSFPVAIYRGVHQEGREYERGDMVTWAGSLWHCDTEKNATKPGTEGWTLAVKKGRDGKDAK